VLNPGAHGFTELLYAFSSAANNNGSAFAVLSANTPFFNTALGLCMLVGRYGVVIPVLALAGALGQCGGRQIRKGAVDAYGRAGGGELAQLLACLLYLAPRRYGAVPLPTGTRKRSSGAGAHLMDLITLLFIEDEPQMRRYLRATLPANGSRLLEAETGKAGLAMAA